MTAGTRPIRVHVVDDDGLVRAALTGRLETLPKIIVTGASRNGAEAIEHVQATDVDVVLMDIVMPGMSGIEATRIIREIRPDVHVILVTNVDDMGTQHSATEAGASGYLLKNAANDLLEQAITVAHLGYRLWAPGYRPAPAANSLPPMTGPQRQVLECQVAGMTITAIKEELYLSPSTIKNYTVQLCKIFGVENRVQLIAEAVRRGIEAHSPAIPADR